MSMELAKQTYEYTPEQLIAGVAIGITTGVKTAAADIKKGAPVLLDKDGKAALVKATGSGDSVSVKTDGLYGIAADSADKDGEVVIYLSGEFFGDALALEENVTADALEVAFRNIGIYLK